ncbi:peroxiredoxin family protein [Bradyrhizobium erythrophlei]|jgi:peroxiredoxin Q/BCP|uniref:thioredoxin-dependent peroxiredoxin n=1 Tax=Bradyrhizobium erythrophlei TaxID=1437360 RepID=A0A1M5QWN7_9BRAD|nr:peroxiredoxin [Bradyrhizobium erythrophlei]SHH18296.1 peroxiredoxin Q/BCP [Bradyrhizobium erythrophlei]
MSKKTRKKSPKAAPQKAASGKAARAQSAKSAKTQRTKSRQVKASESTKKAIKKTGDATRTASQKAPLKALKSAGSKPPAPKISAANTPAPKTAPAPRALAAAKAAPIKAKAASPAASKPPAQAIATPAAGKSGLVEGAKAPAFHLPRDGGGTVSLSDYAGKKLVLFFYPRADTPGCTKEAIDFTRLSAAFAEAETALLGVSADPPKAQEAFRDKHELATPLASDEQHQMLEAYGVWGEKSMYGRTFLGILRTTVLVGRDGRILKVWRNVRVDGHADEVLAAARGS